MNLDKPVGFFLFDYAWVFFILITLINAFILKVRAARAIRDQPELRVGYDQLFKGYILFMNIPWVLMGIGMLVGGVPSTFTYLYPRGGNPFVIAFHISVVILWLLSIWWIYFRGGAEFLVKYKGVFRQDISSPILIKVMFALMLVGGIFGMTIMWSIPGAF